jgi:hypothetical protein
LTEAFAEEFGEIGSQGRVTIDRLLEAYECSMVNEDNRYTGSLKKKAFRDQFEMMEHSINKRIKNDFKDDVKQFFHLMVQPCNSLKQLEKTERLIFLRGYFLGINRWFHQRRKVEQFPTIKGMKLLHGFTMPFDNFPESNTIVSIEKDEFHVFETKERCPYLCVFETIK